MTDYCVDYAWDRPPPQAIKAAGFLAVCRYLSHDRTGKTLTVDEVTALHDAGLGVVLNFEDSAGRALRGGPAGTSDATFANGLADQLGAPRDVPIYYSCDTDPGSPVNGAIIDYYRAIQAVGVRPVGVYGGAVLVRQLIGAGIAQYGWTANARSWDHGVPPCGHMHQIYSHPAGTPTIAGVAPQAYDTSEVLVSDFGAWSLDMPLSQSDANLVAVAVDSKLNRVIGTLQANMKTEWIPAIIAGVAAAVVAKLPPAAGGVAVDQAALSKSIADELAARLKA